MKHFLDLTGLTQFLAKLKTIFVKDISEGSTSGSFQYTTYEEVDDPDHQGQKKLQEKTVSVPVHNVVTTDTEQTISGAKTFTGTVKVPDIADSATDTGLAANKKYVDSKITENDAMSYKGAVYPNSDVTEGHNHLPLTGTTKTQYKVGATFKAAAEGAYEVASGTTQTARIGDLFIVKAVTGSTSPYTLTYDWIPAADDVTSVQYSADGTGINVGTSATYGQAIFGEAAIKPVDTSISANSASTNLPTSAAVADYAISGVTAGSGIEVGTKENGTQSVKIDLATAVPYPGGSDYDASGLTFDSDGKLKISTGEGLEIVQTDGTGPDYNSHLQVKIDSTSANGLSTSSNGVALALATPSVSGVGGTNGAMSAADKEKLDNLDSAYAKNLDVAAGANNTVDLQLKDGQGTAAVLDTVNISSTNKAIGVGVGTASGSTTKLEITANIDNTKGLVIDNTNGLQINNGDGIEFSSGAVQVNIGSGYGLQFNGGALEIEAYDGITLGSEGVSVDIDTTKGLTLSGDTAGSKQVAINNGNGITFTNGAIEAKIDSTNNTGGLDFDANGNIEVVSITNEEINGLFA